MRSNIVKLMCSTALAVALPLGASQAVAAGTVEIDNSATPPVVTITTGLEKMLIGNGQTVADSDGVSAAVETKGEIALESTEATTDDMTLTGSSVTATARLNQATNQAVVQAPLDGGSYSGATAIDASGTTLITAGSGVASSQVVSDIGEASAAVTAGEFTVTGGDAVTGNATIVASKSVADVLVNDVSNVATVTAPVGGTLATSAAIANLQTIDNAAVPMDVTATNTSGLVKVDITGELIGDATVVGDVIGARAGVNQASNQLTAGGTAGGVSGLSTELTLDRSDVTATGITSFNSDYAVANVQTATSTGVDAQIATGANIQVELGADATGDVRVDGNSILADSSINYANNRATVSTSGFDTPSVAVASLQALDGTDGTYNASIAPVEISADLTTGDYLAGQMSVSRNTVAATFSGNVANNVISAGGDSGVLNGDTAVVGRQEGSNLTGTATVSANSILGGVGGDLTGDITVAGNTVTASAMLNQQTNAIVRTSGNALAAGVQNADAVSLDASLTTTTIGSGVLGTSDGAIDVSGNAVKSVAVLNQQTNAIVGTAGAPLGGGTQMLTNSQYITDSGVTATATNVTIGAAVALANTGAVLAGNNTISASAMGNIATNVITSTPAPAFMFNR